MFQLKSPQERSKLVSQKGRCPRCLGGHDSRNCRSKGVCFKCSKRHHTLLHVDPVNKPGPTQDTPLPLSKDSNSVTHNNRPTSHAKDNHFVAVSTSEDCSKQKNNYTVLLATALVKLSSSTGTSYVFRALLDSCSQCDFISERAAQLLNVKRNRSSHCIDGISQVTSQTQGSTQVTIETLTGTTISCLHPVQILSKITSNLPRVQISDTILDKVKPFVLADPSFHITGPIDVLLGGTLFAEILTGENHSLGPDMPHVVGSKFGFIVMGYTTSLTVMSWASGNEEPKLPGYCDKKKAGLL